MGWVWGVELCGWGMSELNGCIVCGVVRGGGGVRSICSA